MYPRKNYEMTQADLNTLLEACKPTPLMMIGRYTAPSPQENANRVWKALGDKMGFDSMTVEPIRGKSSLFFSAVPSETEEAEAARIKREESEKRANRIEELKAQIQQAQSELDTITQ